MLPTASPRFRSLFALLLLGGLLPLTAGCDQHEDVVVVGNDLIVRTFSVSSDDFDISSDDLVASYHREFSEMTSDIVDDGAVLLYADGSLLLSGGGGTWTALPFTVSFDRDDDLDVDETLSFTYSYDLQDLYIDVLASATGYPFEDLPRTEYKLVMIPGDLFVSSNKSGIDYTDYEAVKRAYSLPD